MHFTHKKMNGALAQMFDSFVPAILAHSKQCIRDLMKLNGLPHLQKLTHHLSNQRTNIVVFMVIHITSNWCMYIQTNIFIILKTKKIMKIYRKRSGDIKLCS